MSMIKKLVSFIKKLFKKEEIKQLEETKQELYEDGRSEFVKSLKITPHVKKKNKKVETLICEGDGLGIQKNINW